MDAQRVPLRVTASRFVLAIRVLVTSEVGGTVKWILAALVALLCGVSGLNVINSYVGRNFMTAIADRQSSEFVRQAILYVGIFGALTVVAVVARFAEERLALLWRDFLTRRAVNLYLTDGTFYRLDAAGQLTNPDQRISDDVRAFTVTTLSFLIMMLNSTLTILAFSGVLWSISPLLFLVAVLYAACGSYLTILLGRPLINLNSDQLDKEASFRSGLIHVRENAESILLTDGEERQGTDLLHRLDALVGNFRRITVINRNVGFFTTGYNWLIQIIPALIIAPAFISGKVEFGVITQSGAAFAMLVGAFSFIVTQFQSISTFAAVVGRLSSLLEAIEKSQVTAQSTVESVEQQGRLAYEGLTLIHPKSGAVLLKDLTVSVEVGTRVLLTGAGPAAGAALFRATAGVPTAGSGRIIRPRPDEILFLPQRPYLPQGTLRQLLQPSTDKETMPIERIQQMLRELGLAQIIDQAGGLDEDRDWETLLSLDEQQLLALAKTLLATPRFAFLDRVETVVGSRQFLRILQLLGENSITCIVNGEAGDADEIYDAVLEYDGSGGWIWRQRKRN